MNKKKKHKTNRKSSLCTATIAFFLLRASASMCTTMDYIKHMSTYGNRKLRFISSFASLHAVHMHAWASLTLCVCFCMCLPFSLLLSRILLPSLVFYDISITCMSRHFESHRSHSIPALLLLQLYCKMQIEVQQMHQQNPHKRTHAQTHT